MSYKRNKTRYKNKLESMTLYMIPGVLRRTIYGDIVPKFFTKEELKNYLKENKYKF